MIVSRAINSGVVLTVLLFLAWLWHRSMKRLRYPLACTCGYALTGLNSRRCPECGRSIAGPTLIRDQLGGIKLKIIFLAVLISAAMLWESYRLTVLLLEINRIRRVGVFAFIPGYRLLEGMNRRDVLCIGVGVLLAVTALRRVAVDACAAVRRVQAQLTADMADHLEHVALTSQERASEPVTSATGCSLMDPAKAFGANSPPPTPLPSHPASSAAAPGAGGTPP
jgi:hypothetical protein